MLDFQIRQPQPWEHQPRPYVAHCNKRLLDFSHNDYLGLRDHPRLIASFQQHVATFGLGSGGSPLVCGYDHAKALFEQEFAAFIGNESALLVNNGYQANLAVCSTLLADDAWVFMDKACHASWYDGLRLRGLPTHRIKRYRHQCLDHLQQLLHAHRNTGAQKVIISEGIFSMSGTRSDVGALLNLKQVHSAQLWLDDGHGVAVLGSRGEGVIADVESQCVDVLTYPLGKGFAMQGAVIVASQRVINQLQQHARPYMYSTAMSTAHAATLRCALDLVKSAHEHRAKLQQLIVHWRELRAGLPLRSFDSSTPIQFVICGNALRAKQCASALYQQGIYVYPMCAPTVAAADSGLRVVLNRCHTQAQLQQLAQALDSWCRAQ